MIMDESLWITQKAMAELFGVQVPAISKHLKKIFEEGELDEKVVVSKMEITSPHGAIPGKTQSGEAMFYNLDAIISVGYRVNSKKATRFRRPVLGDILDFLASQISSLTNPTNISNALTSMKNEKINSTLVANYVQHTIDFFLISMAKRYDVKGKTYFEYPNKYYYTDVGLRNARLNYRQYDPGHIMENIIYNELMRRGYSVDVGVVTDRSKGKNLQKEIDFVVNVLIEKSIFNRHCRI